MRLGPGAWAKFAAGGALVLFLCWQHVTATRLGYKVEASRKGARELQGRVAAMRLRLEERLTPAEVAERASRLGMIPASPEALRRLPETRGSTSAAGDAFRRLARRLGTLSSRG